MLGGVRRIEAAWWVRVLEEVSTLQLCLPVHSMQELCENMKLLAFDLQDNNRIIER